MKSPTAQCSCVLTVVAGSSINWVAYVYVKIYVMQFVAVGNDAIEMNGSFVLFRLVFFLFPD